MDDARLWSRMLANMTGMFGELARHSPGGRVLELDGVRAAMVPACPERSVVNCVVYTRAELLGRALDTLAREYDEAGIRAWTVWVPEHDSEAAALLAAAGHLLDAQPAAMVRDLDGIEAPERVPDLIAPELGHVMAINDSAHGTGGAFERAFPDPLPDPAHLYVAAGDGGGPVCSVVTYESDGECGIHLVATVPEAQGRGVARALMRHALVEAHERGCTTTSLQATARGRPVYERLGYRSLGAMQMWERRKQ